MRTKEKNGERVLYVWNQLNGHVRIKGPAQHRGGGGGGEREADDCGRLGARANGSEPPLEIPHRTLLLYTDVCKCVYLYIDID